MRFTSTINPEDLFLAGHQKLREEGFAVADLPQYTIVKNNWNKVTDFAPKTSEIERGVIVDSYYSCQASMFTTADNRVRGDNRFKDLALKDWGGDIRSATYNQRHLQIAAMLDVAAERGEHVRIQGAYNWAGKSNEWSYGSTAEVFHHKTLNRFTREFRIVYARIWPTGVMTNCIRHRWERVDITSGLNKCHACGMPQIVSF